MKKRAFVALAFLATDALAAGPSTVAGSKHDLSVTGPGPIKAIRERNPCIFCHTMHGGGKGLSNRPDPTSRYQPYESSTMKGRTSGPTGSSRICLSCHDGTIAVGQLRKGSIEMTGTLDGKIPATRRSNLGTDLRQSHPFSISASGSPGTHRPPAASRVKADEQDQVQCTSCHEPHSEYGGSTEGRFLVQPTLRAELCATCHPVTIDSSHMASTQAYAARQPQDSAYATVGEAGCMACHRTHGAASKGQLLKLAAAERDEAVCLRCHGATTNVGTPDVGRELAKLSTHSILTGGLHDAAEGPGNPAHRLPEATVGASRHATCADCHNAHEAKHRPGMGQRISGALDGVWGIDELGRRVEAAQFEYQICFKCHGDSVNQPASVGGGNPLAARRAGADANLRRVFARTSPSSHPVIAQGRNADVPSLRPPLTVASQILCSDCHSSDDGQAAGGAGPRGPHGSVYRPLLERNYATADFTAESPMAYALCYKCHDRDTLLSARSAFPLHATHVRNDGAPCSACHAAHGVSSASGTVQGNAHLIDFDLSIVRPGSAAPYSSTGPRSGSCTLMCHGHAHKASPYGPGLTLNARR
ncbi:MAG TPA: cytochrome c3 family protein [Anaeromyxobacter sp.]